MRTPTRTLRTEREVLAYLRSLREQDETAVPPPAPPAAAPPAEPPPAEAPALQPVTVEDIIEKLNIVRSGRSTKDSEVKSELDEYIAQFDEDEKTALLAFLEGLGQILTSGVDSDAAADPRDPYALQIKRSQDGVVPTSAAKSPQPAAAAPAPPRPPVPIKVGGA